MDLFSTWENEQATTSAPLAERMRPQTLEEFVGQQHLFAEESLLRRLIDRDRLPSLIFWGPPGSGKTTLAAIVAQATEARFVSLSAVTSRIADIREVIAQAQLSRREQGRETILFIDEIHRFNKAQQDAFLPHVEQGAIRLIGATTENPSFSVIAPLLSRCKVFSLKALSPADIEAIIQRAIDDRERGFGAIKLAVDEEAMRWMSALADGDARRALNLLELTVSSVKAQPDGQLTVTLEDMKELAQRNQLLYDRAGEEHFNLISALHKSMRSSDIQAALYWMARMLAAGEDPRYVARRLIRFATEDVGMADPHALTVANQARLAYETLGSPEGELALAQAVAYLATAPKSNALYRAYGELKREIGQTGSLAAPLHIRNAPTKLMKDEGYGKGYQYDHNHDDGFAGQECLPEELIGREFYRPSEFGFEREVQKRLAWWKQRKEELNQPKQDKATTKKATENTENSEKK